jgi:integrase
MARSEAKCLLGAIENGADPAADKSARKEAATIADLADRYIAEHVEAKRKHSTAVEYRRLLDKITLPELGKRKVGDITRADVAKLHHANREGPYQADRIVAILSKMFNLAERWGLRPDGSNPCRHVEKFPERKRERMLSPAELARLGDALAAYDGSPYVIAAIKLLVFTGARLGEVLGLRWEWIDLAPRRGAFARQQDRRQDIAPAATGASGTRRIAAASRESTCDRRSEGWRGPGKPGKAVACNPRCSWSRRRAVA